MSINDAVVDDGDGDDDDDGDDDGDDDDDDDDDCPHTGVVKSHPGTAWRSHTRPHKLSLVHLVDQQGDLFIHSFGHGTPRPGAKNKSQPQSQERTPSVLSLSLSLSGKGKPKRPIQ